MQLRPVFLALLVVACAAPPAPAPSGGAALPVPSPPGPLEACQGNMSGLWRHGEDDGFRYVARDDGGVLVLDVSRARADGGHQTSEVVLVRSPGNFVGVVGAARFLGDGGCAALFPAEVVSCADGGLLVATVDRLRVDASCRTLEPAGPRRIHRLVRVSPDAGS